MTPITGPFFKEILTKTVHPVWGYTIVTGCTRRTWYRQKRPYDRPLPFRAEFGKTLSGDADASSWSTDGLPSTWASSATYNRAYDRFVSSFKDKATWGTNLLEYGQARDMIVRRSLQIARALKSLRRGNLGDAFETLKISSAMTGRYTKYTRKSAADDWLEFSFGLSPLIGDIESSVKILTGDPPMRIFRGSAQSDLDVVSGGNPLTSTFRLSQRYSVRIRAEVVLTNPNRFLASSLGLTNPLAIVWEAVPWSFVVDWFVNVGQVLQSYDDLAGVELRNGSHTGKAMVFDELTLYDNGVRQSYQSKTRDIIERRLGVPGPSLRFRGVGLPSVKRAANAVSLLVQQMHKG